MALAKKFKIAPIHEILPQEILVMILKKLGYDSISVARSTCQNWRKVIDDFKLMKTAASKYFSSIINTQIKPWTTESIHHL